MRVEDKKYKEAEMCKSSDSTMEGEIRASEPEHIIRETVSRDKEANNSLIRQRINRELLEEATRSFPRGIVERWVKGESARQIADETGEDIDVLYGTLRELGKAIVTKVIGIEHHEKKKDN